jgi:hypothetical protein
MEEGEATGNNSESTASYYHLQTSRAKTQPTINNEIRSGAVDGKNYSMSSTPEAASNDKESSDPPPPPTGGVSNDSGLEYRVVHCPKITSNLPASTGPFCSNVVVTSKYTIWNFIPKFLLESFKKVSKVK